MNNLKGKRLIVFQSSHILCSLVCTYNQQILHWHQTESLRTGPRGCFADKNNAFIYTQISFPRLRAFQMSRMICSISKQLLLKGGSFNSMKIQTLQILYNVKCYFTETNSIYGKLLWYAWWSGICMQSPYSEEDGVLKTNLGQLHRVEIPSGRMKISKCDSHRSF